MTLTESGSLIDNSTYSKVLAIYTRNSSYELLSFENKNGFDVEKNWSRLQKIGSTTESITNQLNALKISREQFDIDNDEKTDVEVIPKHYENVDGLLILEEQFSNEDDQTRGLIMVDYHQVDGSGKKIDSNLNNFHDWFAELVVKTSRLHFSSQPKIYDADKSLAAEVASFFAQVLKNTTKHDLWEQGGEDYFIERVHYFTSRNLQIESVLPAFPCKSSNNEKVNGLFPDKGEELALRRLISVCQSIKDIYPPGLKLIIVSDGHVFSDCIGVDDDVVDDYTEKLKYLHSKIIENHEDKTDCIGFVSLKDLFFAHRPKELNRVESYVDDIGLPHYTGSKICDDAELSRKFLMAGCDTDAGKLRRDIEQPQHPRLHLYRGFSRFMTEDLSLQQFCKTLSNKAFKRTVSKVAFEMIKRNDAYSNLVELIFPFHLRLSIHAHTNSGPKFGVRVISHEECRTIKALDSDAEPSFEDLLHIPTPWHNCVVKIEGHDHYYLTKSKIVKDAVASEHYKGEWRKTNAEVGAGGYYHLVKN
jgi:pyoverdine/dityrosine biosynthesis protein Dit1